MKLFAIVALSAICATANVAPAQAATINGAATGLATPATTITFGEVALAANTPLTNQFAAQGVTFSGGAYYTPQPYNTANFSGANVGNFPSNGTQNSSITLSFGALQNAAAFNMASNTTSYTFSALLGGTAVQNFTSTVGSSSIGKFYGFSAINFDAIRITSNSNDFFLIDNLQLSSTAAVPEPATWAMLMLGFGALGYGMRRRPKVSTGVRFA